jgi:hypothetical protein
MDLSGVLQSLPGFLQIVNVVVLLSALFFFTSTIASHLVEVIVGFLNSRGKQLRARLEIALGKDAADAFYNDPLIQSLSTEVSEIRTATRSVLGRAWATLPGAAGRAGVSYQDNAWRLHPPSYVEPEFFAKVVATLSNTEGSAFKTSAVINDIKTKLVGVGDQLEPKLVEWFKAINDRQNGVYTRWTFLRLLVIGFLLAALIDIDTVHIAGTLWKNPEQTEKAVKALDDIEKLKLTDAQKNEVRDSVAKAFVELRKIAPPNYAWQNPPKWPFYVDNWAQRQQVKDGLTEWLPKLLGWLLTALATSLGAQFWFNLMSEALKLRAAGNKPKDEPEKAEKKKPDGAVG